jgi:hypothetical protein
VHLRRRFARRLLGRVGRDPRGRGLPTRYFSSQADQPAVPAQRR